MGWLIALAVVVVLAFIPLGFRAIYREKQPGVWVLVGPMSLLVYPGKPKEKQKEKAKKPKEKKVKKSESKAKKGGSFRDFEPVIKTIIQFLGHFRRKIRVNHLELKVILAGDDPCDLAVNYGKAWAALGNLMPQLDRLFVIKKRYLEVECDFTSDETRIYARVDATITLGRAIHLLTWHGIRILKHLLKLRKLRKGGAEL